MVDDDRGDWLTDLRCQTSRARELALERLDALRPALEVSLDELEVDDDAGRAREFSRAVIANAVQRARMMREAC